MATATTTNSKPKRARKPKANQEFLTPDLAPPRIRELDLVLDQLREARGQRIAFGKIETQHQDAALELMDKKQLATYVAPDGTEFEVVRGKRKIKVREPKQTSEVDDEDADGSDE